jgi:RNA polymerase sigma-70 factor (ECF subfamily)
MSASDLFVQPASAPARQFATTRWTLVAAARQVNSPQAREALAALCQAYWYPLYAFARRRLPSVHDAQDLTQAFFAELLEKDYLQAADPRRGKFRAFLLTAFKHFLARQREREGAQKRGGGRVAVPLDFQAGERRYGQEPADLATPDSIYERRWALAILEQTLAQLRQEMAAAGKEKLFDCLKGALVSDGLQQSQAEIAAQLGLTDSAVKAAVFRLRRRYQELLRAEVAQTLTSPAEVEDELRDMFAAVQSRKSSAGCNLGTNIRQ